MPSGRLFGVGVGPGDPELMTLRAVRIITGADVVTYFAARGRPGNAYRTVRTLLRGEQTVERLEYPLTTEDVSPEAYRRALGEFYEASSARLAAHLDAGREVAAISEGDPLFYGSYMHLHVRLAARYPTEVVPGVTAFAAACAASGTPIASGDERLSVLPATLAPDALAEALGNAEAAVIMKVGRRLDAVRAAVHLAGKQAGALYAERVGFPGQRVMPLSATGEIEAPYFSLVLVPGGRLGEPVAPVPGTGLPVRQEAGDRDQVADTTDAPRPARRDGDPAPHAR